MNLYIIMSFATCILAFIVTEQIIKATNFDLRRIVRNRFFRLLIIFLIFVFAVIFNASLSDYKNIFSLQSFAYVFAYGVTLKILIHCLWSKKSKELTQNQSEE